MNFGFSEDQERLRAEIRALCAAFDGKYWRDLDRDRTYPQAFVDCLTQASYLSALIAKEYRRRFGEWQDLYARQCRENQIDYVLVDTSVPFDRSLLSYLEKRRRLG